MIPNDHVTYHSLCFSSHPHFYFPSHICILFFLLLLFPVIPFSQAPTGTCLRRSLQRVPKHPGIYCYLHPFNIDILLCLVHIYFRTTDARRVNGLSLTSSFLFLYQSLYTGFRRKWTCGRPALFSIRYAYRTIFT